MYTEPKHPYIILVNAMGTGNSTLHEVIGKKNTIALAIRCSIIVPHRLATQNRHRENNQVSPTEPDKVNNKKSQSSAT